MPDQLDRAAMYEELDRSSAMLTSRKPEPPAARGTCLWCETPLPAGMRWCDVECSHEYDHGVAAQRRNGR